MSFIGLCGIARYSNGFARCRSVVLAVAKTDSRPIWNAIQIYRLQFWPLTLLKLER
jgi:hypothetical protein